MPNILVVEDEPSLVVALRDTLESEGYTVETATDGYEGYDMATGRRGNKPPDLIMLDLVLPRMNGLELCQQLRAAQFETPIIMLTARGTPSDAAFGLKLGADDYIPKPFDVSELLARVAAVLRRTRPRASEQRVRIGDLELDFGRLTAQRNDVPVELSAREFEVLQLLVAHRGSTVTREQLLHHIWGENASLYSRTIDAHIARLRQKIEPEPGAPRYIITVHRTGYRLVV
jgi:DNA-binding response OmpR family regulator